VLENLEFVRFPELYLKKDLNQKRLIWDTRQYVDEGAERVYINPSLSEELKEELRKRSQSKGGEVVETPDALFQLGQDVSESLNFPSLKLRVVGVTGTNGKTSTVEGLSWLYSSLGKKVLQIGTLGISVWDKGDSFGMRKSSLQSGFTTPEAPSLHQIFSDAAANGVDVVVMEVSSHALELGRVAGIEFDAAIFTNLSQDHLDFHGTMKAYSEAKQKLFKVCLQESKKTKKFAVCAVPDELSAEFAKALTETLAAIPHVMVELNKSLKIITNSIEGLCFEWNGKTYRSRLLGIHNAWNLSLALALLEHEGYGVELMQKMLPFFPGPVGRLERVAGNCFVDFAHTPDALENVLKTIKGFAGSSGRIFCVMGCGGNRDRTKRPLMGAIATKFSDRVWITNDNPRFEDPEFIASEIIGGVPESERSKVKIVLGRSEAIVDAIGNMGESDILLVAGKGHETYQIVKDEKKHFSDQEEILKVLKTQ